MGWLMVDWFGAILGIKIGERVSALCIAPCTYSALAANIWVFCDLCEGEMIEVFNTNFREKKIARGYVLNKNMC